MNENEPHNMKRRERRELLMKLIFQSEFQSSLKHIEPNEASKLSADDSNYITNAYDTFIQYKSEIDGIIMSHLKSTWKIEQLNKVDLAILRLAILEFLYLESTDAGVAINEAVELTRKYSGEESVKFVNGLLGAVYRSEQ